jgi:hypothetical protein
MEVSVVPGCGLRSRVRGFESCRRLAPALLWTPDVILTVRELHVIRSESAQCPARVAGRLVPYVTDPRRVAGVSWYLGCLHNPRWSRSLIRLRLRF